MQGHAQQVQRIGIGRVVFEDFPVQVFGPLNLAAAVSGNGLSQLCSRCGGVSHAASPSLCRARLPARRCSPAGIGLATGDRRIFSAAAEFAGESSGTDRQDRSSRRSRGGGDSV